MNVKELIEELQKISPELPVGHTTRDTPRDKDGDYHETFREIDIV